MTNPRVEITTELGAMILEIYLNKAPLTAANFMRYVNEERFAGAVFYRVVHAFNQPDKNVKIEVIQGGLKADDHPQALPAIEHESTARTGILHEDGTLSMARNEPGTASSEFFICIGRQSELDFGGRRNPDGQGFAAFGKVTAGMEIVRKIQMLPERGQYLIKPVRILAVKTLE